MTNRPGSALRFIFKELPRLGRPGSRSAELHSPALETLAHEDVAGNAGGLDVDKQLRRRPLNATELSRFLQLRWVGTTGALLLGLGGLGAGALPVVDNPYASFPGGSVLSRMLQASTIVSFLGVALLVLAWIGMAPFCASLLKPRGNRIGTVSLSLLRRSFLAWSLPILMSAPMFTQDIYSYLANGKIVRLGLDPYSAGPIDILGTADPLVRSVPFIWAHSPSPYGPVSLGLASLISRATGDSILLGVFAHRLISIAGLGLASWALVRLARRCRVTPQAALWLGILNPLTILHLVGGIHNEAILLGLLLAGLEIGLSGVDRGAKSGIWLLCAGGFLISAAGMVKVTGFIGLGFLGMALARKLSPRFGTIGAITLAAGLYSAVLVASVALVTALSGIGLGWITGQGGAVAVRSWMSISTAVGVISGFLGSQLGFGNHTEAMLAITRGVGIAISMAFMLRMLLATYRGAIHPVGGLGVSTFVLVIFFPVVHPWYLLWAILPLAAWANRPLFRVGVFGYSVLMSFFVLPRGLSLPPATVLSIYFGAALALAVLVLSWVWLRRRGGFKRRRMV